MVEKIKELSSHPEKGIRLKVVERGSGLQPLPSRLPWYLLGAMTKDADPEVKSMAAVELARFGERIAGDVIERIKQYLLAAHE